MYNSYMQNSLDKFFQDIKDPANAIYALLEFGLLEV